MLYLGFTNPDASRSVIALHEQACAPMPLIANPLRKPALNARGEWAWEWPSERCPFPVGMIELAAALLMPFVGPPLALAMSNSFACDVIADFHHMGWSLWTDDVCRWVERKSGIREVKR